MTKTPMGGGKSREGTSVEKSRNDKTPETYVYATRMYVQHRIHHNTLFTVTRGYTRVTVFKVNEGGRENIFDTSSATAIC